MRITAWVKVVKEDRTREQNPDEVRGSVIDLAGRRLNGGIFIHDCHQGSNSMHQCVHADTARTVCWYSDWHDFRIV